MQEHDPFDIARQAATEAERSDAAVLVAEIERSDTEWLMGDERGRRIARGLLAKAGVWRSSFSSDSLLMAFREGARSHGLELLARIDRHTPEKYQLMLQEGKE